MKKEAPYGYCPVCHSPGITRTRCMDCSSDTCENGHKYKASESIQEVAPPGWSGTVKAMKKHKSLTSGKTKDGKEKNVFALAWHMKNQGDEAHYKPLTNEKQKPKKKKKYSEWLKERNLELYKETFNKQEK